MRLVMATALTACVKSVNRIPFKRQEMAVLRRRGRAIRAGGKPLPAWGRLLPGEYRLLEVRHPDRAAVQGHLAELIDDRRSRRVQIPAKERQLTDRRLRLRNTQQPGRHVQVSQRDHVYLS